MQIKKLILLILAINCVFGESVVTTSNANSGYIAVPLSPLESIYEYINDQIIDRSPEMKDWKLSKIMQKEDKTQGRNIYNFTYSKLQIQNDKLVIVSKTFSFQMMFTITSGHMTIPVTTTQPNNNNNAVSPATGSFVQGDTTSLTSIQQAAFNFVIKNIPKLNVWAFTNIRSKVVSGSIICFTFNDFLSGNKQEHCVWSQPWRNFMQFVLPNGQKIAKGSSQSGISNNQGSVNSIGTNTAQNNPTTQNNPTPQNTPPTMPSQQSTTTPSTSSPKTSPIQPSPATGSFRSSNPNSLTPSQQESRNYLVSKVKKLQTWVLKSVKTQVVAGQNTCYTYENPANRNTEEYCVWSKPWRNFFQITLPNGQKLSQTSNPTVASAPGVASAPTYTPSSNSAPSSNPSTGSNNPSNKPSNGVNTPSTTQNNNPSNSGNKPSSNSQPATGAFSRLNPSTLTVTEEAAKAFLLSKVPKLSSWTEVAMSTQVVAGENTCWVYMHPVSAKSQQYCVWSQPWNNFMQITLPDGTKIIQTGNNS